MDQDHYWANWSNACPYTIDSVYVMVQFWDRSKVPIGEGVWALHFVMPGEHRVTRFTAPRNVPDFDSVRVHKITASSVEALLEPLPVPDRPAVVKVVATSVEPPPDHISIPDVGPVALPVFAEVRTPPADLLSAADHNRRGRELLAAKDYARAIEELSEAIRQKPDYSLAYNARGFARFLTQQYQPALADLDEAIRLNPTYVNAYQNRSQARRAAGDLNGSVEDARTIRKLLRK
jgi:tetratricopeptide (TPR) repeat protein